jgi:hypothetical protein
VDYCAPLSPPYTSAIPTSLRSTKFYALTPAFKKKKRFSFIFPEKKTIAFEVCSFALLGEFYLLNPTGHVTHQQFNIQQLYALPTLYLYVLYLSESKQRLVPLTA